MHECPIGLQVGHRPSKRRGLTADELRQQMAEFKRTGPPGSGSIAPVLLPPEIEFLHQLGDLQREIWPAGALLTFPPAALCDRCAPCAAG